MITCYLCGKPISGATAHDHVPPQQFFAPILRKKFNLDQLTTLPVHPACTDAYGKDEEYFTWSLSAIASDSAAGAALLYDNAAKFRAGSRVGLGRKVLREFQRNPSGLHLPPGLIVKQIDAGRVERVAWKLVRGLYNMETGLVLPETTGYLVEIAEPEREPESDFADLWFAVRTQPSNGAYGGVFAYKYLRASAESDPAAVLHLWAMLLWDKVIVFLAHHDPLTYVPDNTIGGGAAA